MTKTLKLWLATLDDLAFKGLALIVLGLILLSGVMGLWLGGFFESDANLLSEGANSGEITIEESLVDVPDNQDPLIVDFVIEHRPVELQITLLDGVTQQPIPISQTLITSTRMTDVSFQPTGAAALLEKTFFRPVIRLPFTDTVDFSNLILPNTVVRIVDQSGESRRFKISGSAYDVDPNLVKEQVLFDQREPGLALVWFSPDGETLKMASGMFELELENAQAEVQAAPRDAVALGAVMIKVEVGGDVQSGAPAQAGYRSYGVKANFSTNQTEADLGNISAWLEDAAGEKYYPLDAGDGLAYTQLSGVISATRSVDETFVYQLPASLDSDRLYQKFSWGNQTAGITVWLPFTPSKSAPVLVELSEMTLSADESRLLMTGSITNNDRVTQEVLRGDIRLIQSVDMLEVQLLSFASDEAWSIEPAEMLAFSLEFEKPVANQSVLCILGHQFAIQFDAQPTDFGAVDCSR